jgi:hypothetical protein
VSYLMTLDGFKNEGNTIGFASSDMKQQPPAPRVTKMFYLQCYWVGIKGGVGLTLMLVAAMTASPRR